MREFNLSTGGAGVVAASVTLLYLRAPVGPSVNIEVLRWWASQTGSTTSTQVRIDIAQRGTVFPTLVALTPVTLKTQDPNASVLLGSTNGAAATSGSTASAEGAGTYPQLFIEDAFNILNGWLHVPTPPETIINPAGSNTGIALRFPTNPGSINTWSFGCNFREV
jgi:hypothetical protein